jgi:hypothetical protein
VKAYDSVDAYLIVIKKGMFDVELFPSRPCLLSLDA